MLPFVGGSIGSSISMPVLLFAGAALVGLVLTGINIIKTSGYQAAELHNVRAVAMAERETREKQASDLAYLHNRQGKARDTEKELRREVDLWRERARAQATEAVEDLAGVEACPYRLSECCIPGCLNRE